MILLLHSKKIPQEVDPLPLREEDPLLVQEATLLASCTRRTSFRVQEEDLLLYKKIFLLLGRKIFFVQEKDLLPAHDKDRTLVGTNKTLMDTNRTLAGS